VYALPETLAAIYRFVFGLAGFELPELHRAPIASASLGEFWGQRWNRTIGAWLRRHCFLPFARRRRPGVGIAVAFVASTALHAWLAGVAVGWVGGAIMGAYFVVQGALVWLESRVRPGPIASRAWALLGAGVPAPLFVEPILWAFAPLVSETVPQGLV
jgi:D-alanyl-lipoteichoic acid acyltransferase DltB (MBOAT superfamily)